MGWKNVKDHFRIGHTVQVTSEGICIGSPYIHNLIVIGLDGVVKKGADGFCNVDLDRYMNEFAAYPDVLKHLVMTPDTFSKSFKVYTYDDGDIIEKKCEAVGWPNITHDGQLMYENTFSTDRAKVVKWARENAAACVRICKDTVKQSMARLKEAEERLDQAMADVEKLKPKPKPKSKGPPCSKP